MWVAPCSWRTRMSLIFESTSASKIGIAAPPESPKTYSTPSRSRQRISASAPVCSLVTGLAAGADLVAGLAGTENLAFESARSEATSNQPIRPVVYKQSLKTRCRFDHFNALLCCAVRHPVSFCGHEPRLAWAIRVHRAPGGGDFGRQPGAKQRPFDLRFRKAALAKQEPAFRGAAPQADRRVGGARAPVVAELAVDVVTLDVEGDPVTPPGLEPKRVVEVEQQAPAGAEQRRHRPEGGPERVEIREVVERVVEGADDVE